MLWAPDQLKSAITRPCRFLMEITPRVRLPGGVWATTTVRPFSSPSVMNLGSR